MKRSQGGAIISTVAKKKRQQRPLLRLSGAAPALPKSAARCYRSTAAAPPRPSSATPLAASAPT